MKGKKKEITEGIVQRNQESIRKYCVKEKYNNKQIFEMDIIEQK